MFVESHTLAGTLVDNPPVIVNKKDPQYWDDPDFVRFYRGNRQALMRYLQRYLHQREAAEDGVQHVFMQLWRRKQAGQLEEDARRYLFVSAKNYILECRRKANSRIVVNDNVSTTEQEEAERRADGITSEDAVAYRELLQEAVASIKKLSEKTQRAFALYYGYGMSYSQVAEKMGISVRTVERHMAAANECARKALAGKYP